MIIIHPREGLCNRMRAIDSAILLAEDTGSKVHVVWEKNKTCNSSFHDLFEMPSGVYRLTEIDQGVRNFNLRVEAVFSRYKNCYISQPDMAAIKERVDWLALASKYRHMYVCTWSRFMRRPDSEPFSTFKPIKSLQKTINRYSLDHIIGVHVRRSDNKKAIAYSPITGFIDQMKKELEGDKNTVFFLATDDAAVEEELESVFPGKIMTYIKSSLDRNNPSAIRDAVVDLYALANCKKIIGSHWSSFSLTAAEIGGRPRVTIRENRFTLAPFLRSKYPLIVSLHENLQIGESDDGELLVENDRGKLLTLNAMSAAILNLCKQKMPLLDIVALFNERYPDDKEVVEKHLVDMLENLVELRVIAVRLDMKQR